MKIIDFKREGNSVRFYMGEESLRDWWGDDWNDAPYELNAGCVYPQFIAGFCDVLFSDDDVVVEPEDSSHVCKLDMVKRRIPCIVHVPAPLAEKHPGFYDFWFWLGVDGAQRIYFGDSLSDVCIRRWTPQDGDEPPYPWEDDE